MELIRIPYREINADPICDFRVNVTPDGWVDAGKAGTPLTQKPQEITEMVMLINDLIKLFPTLDELRKYFRRNGKKIRSEGADPTLAITVSREKATYNIEETGPFLRILAYRNAK